MTRGRICGRGHLSLGNRPTCQLCGKYSHVVVECWHRFDETITSPRTQSIMVEFPSASTDKHGAKCEKTSRRGLNCVAFFFLTT